MKEVLLNTEVIAVNQDKLGHWAKLLASSHMHVMTCTLSLAVFLCCVCRQGWRQDWKLELQWGEPHCLFVTALKSILPKLWVRWKGLRPHINVVVFHTNLTGFCLLPDMGKTSTRWVLCSWPLQCSKPSWHVCRYQRQFLSPALLCRVLNHMTLLWSSSFWTSLILLLSGTSGPTKILAPSMPGAYTYTAWAVYTLTCTL